VRRPLSRQKGAARTRYASNYVSCRRLPLAPPNPAKIRPAFLWQIFASTVSGTCIPEPSHRACPVIAPVIEYFACGFEPMKMIAVPSPTTGTLARRYEPEHAAGDGVKSLGRSGFFCSAASYAQHPGRPGVRVAPGRRPPPAWTRSAIESAIAPAERIRAASLRVLLKSLAGF